jgi:hypothetical protein
LLSVWQKHHPPSAAGGPSGRAALAPPSPHARACRPGGHGLGVHCPSSSRAAAPLSCPGTGDTGARGRPSSAMTDVLRGCRGQG